MPLSDKDYKMLREEDARSCYKIWQLASPELREAFNKKEAERVDNRRHPKTGWPSKILPGKIESIARIMREPEDEDCGDTNT